MAASSASRLLLGAKTFLAGMRHSAADPDVRRAYRWILLVLFAVALVLNAAGIFGVIHFLPISADDSTWKAVGYWILRVIGILAILVASPILAISLCNLLLPVFSEIPFLAGLRALGSPLADELAASEGLPIGQSILFALRRMSLGIVLAISTILLGLIPLVGPFLAPAAQLFWGSRIIGWEMLDPYFDKRRASLQSQKELVARLRPEVMGMGLIAMGLLAIPFIGPLFFGLVQSAAAKFVVEFIEKETDEQQALGEGSSGGRIT